MELDLRGLAIIDNLLLEVTVDHTRAKARGLMLDVYKQFVYTLTASMLAPQYNMRVSVLCNLSAYACIVADSDKMYAYAQKLIATAMTSSISADQQAYEPKN